MSEILDEEVYYGSYGVNAFSPPIRIMREVHHMKMIG